MQVSHLSEGCFARPPPATGPGANGRPEWAAHQVPPPHPPPSPPRLARGVLRLADGFLQGSGLE